MVNKNKEEQLKNYDKDLKWFSNDDKELEQCKNNNIVNITERTVGLFFSFDIVNSSSYKNINCFGWPVVITTLMEELKKYVTKEIVGAKLWRVLGDEIIFFITIREINKIYEHIESIFNILHTLTNKLKSGVFFEKIGSIGKNTNLSLQASSWIAILLTTSKKDFQEYDNIFQKYDNIFQEYIFDDNKIYEFLGQDIDTGFRIKKETQDRRLSLSFELACILSEKTYHLSNLNIITYKNLKGVWNNRLYPIIWYHNKDIAGRVFEDSFYYDETTYSSLSKEYFINREKEEGNITSYMFLDVNKALNKIKEDLNLKDKIEQIKSVIKAGSTDTKNIEDVFSNNLMEFHCAVVCCDAENKKILILKRNSTDLWEFGCIKVNSESNLIEYVVNGYKEKFGIEIEIVCNKERTEKQPIPFALYEIDKNGKKHKGVIVVAKVINKELSYSKEKYSDLKWISVDEVENFQEDAVDDFKNTLNAVFSKWNDLFKGE